MNIFNFFDLVELHVDEALVPFSGFCQREFGSFKISRNRQSAPYVVAFQQHDRSVRAQFDVSVGDMMFRRDDEYYISDGNGNLAEWFQGKPYNDRVEIALDHGFHPYRAYYYLFLPILKHYFKRAGMTFLHSSAVEYGGARIGLSGWGGTGKTNALLGLIEAGASYLGDDLIIADRKGNLFPFPRSINVYHYNLETVPKLRHLMSPGQRARARLASLFGRIVIGLVPKSSYAVSVVQKRLSNTYVSSTSLGAELPELVGSKAALFVLMLRDLNGEVRVSEIDTSLDSVTNACVANLKQELQPIQSYYWMYAFLSGRAPETVVTDEDVTIVGEFLRRTRVVSLALPAGARIEKQVLDLVVNSYKAGDSASSVLEGGT